MGAVINGAKAVPSRKGPGSHKGQDGPPEVKVGRDKLHKLLPPSGSYGSSGSFRGAVCPTDEEAQDYPLCGPFPVDALPPVARGFVLQAAAAGRVPLALPAAAVLGVGAAAIGRGLLVENDKGAIPGNLFVALVASSGMGKKLVFDRCMTPFVNLHHELADNWRSQIRPRLLLKLKARRRALKQAEDALQDAAGTPEEEDAEQRAVDALNEVGQIERDLGRRPTLHITDPNRLALARAMQGQVGEACAVMSSEAVGGVAGLLGAGMGNGQGSEGFICACYSGDVFSDDRLSRDGITLRNPCLTLVPFVQPDVMRGLLANQKLVDRGLLARFLMVGDENNPVMPGPVAQAGDLDGPWGELVRSLTLEYRMNQQGRREPVTIKASAEVMAIFSAYRDAVEKDIVPGGRLTDIEPFVRRWPEQAARIALVLHALRHGAKAHARALSPASAGNAVDIGKWFAAHQVEMLDGYRVSRRHARAEQLRGVLLQHPGQTASLGKLSKSHGFKDNEVRELCADFPRLFRLKPKPSGVTGGRPTEYVEAA
jgi:hypothetical protein